MPCSNCTSAKALVDNGKIVLCTSSKHARFMDAIGGRYGPHFWAGKIKAVGFMDLVSSDHIGMECPDCTPAKGHPVESYDY